MNLLPDLPRPVTRVLLLSVAVSLAVLALAAPVRAQAGAVPAPPQSPAAARTQSTAFPGDTPDARRVREQFVAVLKQYPPSLGQVLKLDPSLFDNAAFMAPYPSLVAFVTQYPAVKRNPDYFLQSFGGDYYSGYARSEAARMWDGLIGGIGAILIMLIVVTSLGWAIRTFMDYRRWHRLSKTQVEAHTKLLDRFTANEELIAYVQSPAGRKFLESAPIALDSGARAVAAPFGRILWSVQAGLVAAAGGLGLWYVSNRMTADFTAGRVTEDLSQPLYTMGVFALAIGVGFVLSAVVSYMLSRRLGLLDQAGAPGASGRQTLAD